MTRDKIIIRASIIGILANVFLAGFKAFVGVLSSSIAVIMDAVNNLSDALSSIITIIGTKLANKPADAKHPLGYGRIEFISAAVISLIVLYAGVTSLIESIKKIISPVKPDYGAAAIVIIIMGIIVKVVLGTYVKGVGVKVNSDSLVNSGTDALLDSVISTSTLVAAIVYILFGLSLEAWLGAIISLVIIKSGTDMIMDSVSQILGERVPMEVSKSVKGSICSVDGVRGAYDLILHSYGPDKLEGSVHIEIPDTMMADEIDTLMRKVQERVFTDTGVILTGISIYAFNTKEGEATDAYRNVLNLVKSVEHVKQIHGFYFSRETMEIRFDAVITFDADDLKAQRDEVERLVKEAYPDFDVYVTLDNDVSD